MARATRHARAAMGPSHTLGAVWAIPASLAPAEAAHGGQRDDRREMGAHRVQRKVPHAPLHDRIARGGARLLASARVKVMSVAAARGGGRREGRVERRPRPLLRREHALRGKDAKRPWDVALIPEVGSRRRHTSVVGLLVVKVPSRAARGRARLREVTRGRARSREVARGRATHMLVPTIPGCTARATSVGGRPDEALFTAWRLASAVNSSCGTGAIERDGPGD